jgi:protocatechuate 3,4-dioxygenase beta subunit
MAAVCWGVGALLMTGRLILGMAWLARLLSAAQPAGRTVSSMWADCRSDLAVRRKARLLTHPAVRLPMVIGGPRPAVLLPADWEELPPDNGRAALLHELMHLARWDDWTKLIDELVRAVFFFHPLVHWLVNALDADRERLCDGAVLRHGIAPRQLAHVLLGCAKRVGAGRPALALPFFNRSTVKHRIEQLLEDDMALWSTPLSCGHKLTIASFVLCLMAGLGTFGVRAAGSAPTAQAAVEPKPQESSKAVAAVSGVVQDSDGKPVGDATVILGNWLSREKPLMVQSDASGRFAFAALPQTIDHLYALSLMAGKQGYAPATSWASDKDDAFNRNRVLKLARTGVIAGSVRDGGGRPIAGARVMFGMVDTNGEMKSWGYAHDELLRGTPLEQFFLAQTDRKGRFELKTVPLDKELIFRVTAQGFAEMDTAMGGPKGQYFASDRAAEVVLTLNPEARLHGRLISRAPGVQVGGLHIRLKPRSRTGSRLPQAWTDAEGRFNFDGLSEGAFVVLMDDSPDGATWTPRNAPVVTTHAGTTSETQVELIEGAVVEGLVVAADTAMPVANAAVGGHGPARPKSTTDIFRIFTDVNGRYHLRLPPGETEFYVQTPPAGYMPSSPTSVVIPAEVKTFTGPTLTIQKSTAVEGQALDAQDRSVEPAPLVQKPAKDPAPVRPDELAGTVVGEDGKPLEGVHVHVWDWVDLPQNQTRTDKNGFFRLKDCGRDSKVQVRFRKPGYSPVMFVQQPTGVSDWVVAMDSKTYFEGVVRGPDGKPAANALIRANQGPKQGDGVLINTIWTETKADREGRYRLYVEPDAYEFMVKAPGVGVARLPKTAIDHGQKQTLDFTLEPGVTFRAMTVDSQTGLPIAGVRLWHWQHKDVEGRSNAKGEIAISGMFPGRFDFSVDAPSYTRWWSDDAASEWSRKQVAFRPGSNWQRNFDNLDFDLHAGMSAVRIVLEQGVTISGHVLDPEGKPVAKATVAPALTGSGNSLTGDTRFSVATKADGSYEVLLPASGEAEYNLVAHDGKYGEWRKWANGVLPPLKTTPGQVLRGATLKLTRPAMVRGKVVDAQGKPIPHREVRAHAADKLENRYYDPTTTTREDGTFELRFIRPGEQFIQVAPFWLTAEEAPAGSSEKLHLNAGQKAEGIALVPAER